MFRFKKFSKFVFAILFSIGIISSQQIVNAADTIKLGLNFTNSGMLKTQGEGTEIAVDIAVAEINASGGINGKQIELIKYETGSDPKQAVVGTRKLAEDDKVLAIIGPFSSGEAAAAACGASPSSFRGPPPSPMGVQKFSTMLTVDGVDFYRVGGSTVVLNADARWRICAQCRDAVQRRLHVACSVNLYATPAGARTLEPHADDHCVFVAQLSGAKLWRIFLDGEQFPDLGATLPRPADDANSFFVTLYTGDVLYVPRGAPHVCQALDGEPSIHVSVGLDLDPTLTWISALQTFVSKARGDRHREDLLEAARAAPELTRVRAPFREAVHAVPVLLVVVPLDLSAQFLLVDDPCRPLFWHGTP